MTACEANPGRRSGLSDLERIPLPPAMTRWLAELGKVPGASPEVAARLRAEARDLLALEVLTGGRRLRVHGLALAGGDLRAMLELRVPVPVMAVGTEDEPRVEPVALLMVMYPAEAVRRPVAGIRFVAIARPAGVWHPNAAPRDPRAPHAPQGLCLGPRLPAGIRLVEILLLAYQALAMQGIGRELDALNPAGVLQPAAARWWQAHANQLPLSREPFLPPPTSAC